jgi:mono/diheme cytochrome c family protein
MKILKITIVLTVLALFVFACTQDGADETANETATNNADAATPAPTATPDELAAGRKLYQQNCAKCHQEDGTGGKVEIEGKTITPEDLTTEKMIKHSDEEYIEYMVKGIPDEGMPSFKDVLSDAEMKDIVRYIREDLQK